MKRIFTVVALYLLLLCLPAAAQSADAATCIVSFNVPDETYAVILPLGDDAQAPALPKYAEGILENGQSVWCEIRWNLRRIDTTETGWGDVTGKIQIPEGYTCTETDLQLRYGVLVYDPQIVGGVTVLDAHVSALGNAIRVPQGADEAARAAFFNTYRIDAVGQTALRALLERNWIDDGRFYVQDDTGQVRYFTYSLVCDMARVDFSVPGSYVAFDAPPAYFALGDVAKQDLSIHVLAPDAVDLRGWTRFSLGQISMSWFREIRSPELWVRVDDGPWQQPEELRKQGLCTIPSGLCYGFNEDYRTGLFIELTVDETSLKAGHLYEFEVRYEDGGVSVSSILLDLRNGHRVSYGNAGGSRGGSDREEIEEPAAALGGIAAGAAADRAPDPAQPADAFAAKQTPLHQADRDAGKKVSGGTSRPKTAADLPDAEAAPSQPPANGAASIATVAALSALGAAVIWLLLGKRLVKRR